MADYIVLHIENLEITKKVLELITKSIKLQNIKLIYKYHSHIHKLITNYQKVKKIILLIIVSKKIKYLNSNNKVKDLFSEETDERNWRQLINGKLFKAHRWEKLNILKMAILLKQSTDSKQSQSQFWLHFFSQK